MKTSNDLSMDTHQYNRMSHYKDTDPDMEASMVSNKKKIKTSQI